MHTTLNRSSFHLADVSGFKEKMLNWLKPFSIFCYLDNQRYPTAPQQAECLVAAGATALIQETDFYKTGDFIKGNSWVFGHLSYELKNLFYPAGVQKVDRIGFPVYCFFAPEIVLEIKGETLTVHAGEPQSVFEAINVASSLSAENHAPTPEPTPVLSREEYLRTIRQLQNHILRGDCYEINFCQEFFSAGAEIDPFSVFEKLMNVSPNPFSAFYRLHDKYLLCASPERYLLKKGQRVVSQPIKGTIRRDLASVEADDALKDTLLQSPKEQSENVMIVDLVRNDLSRVCKESSVIVDELFGIYSFPQVHQMISTVSGELREGISFPEIIAATFPMGSMTGAPKHRVVQLIDEYECGARGIFSGSVGYINPDGDFDFNVVIRSIMYNAATNCLSYKVGSGITFYSDPEKEWEECLLKAEAIRKVLG